MRVTAEIRFVTLENDDSVGVESVCARCTRCGHETESYGTSDLTIKRCLVLLREGCPMEENNFYVAEED